MRLTTFARVLWACLCLASASRGREHAPLSPSHVTQSYAGTSLAAAVAVCQVLLFAAGASAEPEPRRSQPGEGHRHRHRQSRRHLRFSQPLYQDTVPEDMPAGASILKVTATDPRMDSSTAISYSVNDTVNFRIDEDGVLYNNHQLDYEKGQHMYCLQVEAETHGGRRWRRRKAQAAIHIHVTDAAESPHFDSSHYYYSIPEFATPGTFVGKVVALDDDGDLEHYALDGVEPPNMFIVDRVRGFIAVGRSPLDKQWVYHFRAVAIDYHGHVASVPVTVHIIASRPWYAQHMGRNKPENRHKPVFPECDSYDGVRVRENMTAGTPVVLVLATDEDTGQNGHVIYTLINSFDSFTVQASNQHGQITTTRRLDRDQGDKDFVLTVIGRDSAREALQDSCSFRVVVEDVNDNAPIFDQPRYDQTLATDHRAGTTVLRVTASDLDAGDNGRISYSLLARQPLDLDYFAIDSSSGIVSLRAPLDGSMANSRTLELTAQAQDAGEPALSSTVPVAITVVSTGELPPTIVRQDPLRPSVLENTTENTPVVTVCARSNLADSPNVYFTLINGNTKDTNSEGTFALRRLPDSSSACVDSSGVSIFVATRNLDYETVQSYTLLLQVVNDQNARLDERIPVEIVDVNDNAPLLQPFDGAVVENADGALITTIVAVDLDASPEFRELIYKFDATATEDVRDKFALKPNGELWTTKPLDREEVKQYRVPIQVTDGVPEHERMTTYWITVQDLNDVAPVFAPSGVFEVELPENRELGKPTGIRLPVHDPDIVSQHEYEIISGNEEEKFRIDSATGDVLVNRPLDFDHPVFDRNFTMRVRVSDGANAPAETEITIAVTNVNDLQPVFERANYTFTVTENADCNITFGKVSAIDPDLPMSENQNILYYLSSLELANFTIGDTSGELSLKGCLDREAATRGTMTFYPRANDEGGRGHDANPATVELTILDLNDNHPHFRLPKPDTARIPENVIPEDVDPILIQLDDLDAAGNGCPCQMDFMDSTPPALRGKFNLTEVEGADSQYALRPTATLDREEQKAYELPFLTRDSQGVSGIRFLTLEVGDENDSPMTDGTSSIKVYNYKGQFPAMVIGSVHVTDLDDYDLDSKSFEVDPVTSLDAQKHFRVDRESGDITMLEGTPAGSYTLRVKVRDSERGETATGRVAVKVVGLTKDAVMQSGSLRISSISAKKMMESSETAGGRSLYERLKGEIANLHNIRVDQVDIFTLRDVDGGVDVRYNCHSSPYYSTVRLNAVMMQRRERVAESLGVEIPLIDMNLCLLEGLSPCGDRSCQHTMRPNLTAPLVVAGETATMVGLDITDDYICGCGEFVASGCSEDYCFNGGTCQEVNKTLSCACLDDSNYGPRCELMTARFERGFAWYEPPSACENSSLSMVFETSDASGVLLYTGPTVPRPWPGYPKDFLYVFLNQWTLEAYLDLGSGTLNLAIPLEENYERTFELVLSWGRDEVVFEVIDCGVNATKEDPVPCRRSLFLPGTSRSPSHLLNVQGPLQLGGIASMASFRRLSASYRWTLTPPAVLPFSGCVFELRHNDYLYDLNATDYHKMTFHPCDAPRAAKVVLGHQPATIIFASVLCLLLVVLVILCLARRTRKAISYPDLEREVVKETLGRTDVEGFGEKDVTNFDFKFLQVTPDGQLLTEDGLLPDVALEARQRRRAPLAQMPEGLSIGDFISENILKVDQEYEVPDDVIHFSCQDGGMSVASLSPLASDFSEYGLGLDWRRRNPRPFARPPAREDEGEAGEEEDEEEDDSDYEELDDPPRRVSSSFQESLPTDHSRSSSHSPASNTTSHSPSSTLSEAEEGSSSSALTPKEEEEEEEEEEPSQDAMTLVLEEGVEGDEEEGEVEEEVNCLEDDVAASTSVACREHGTSC